MTAYYNEFNPDAAETLRQLIEENQIAPGVVDERSIADVTPGDLAGFTQCHFFAGVGGWSRALRLAGVRDSDSVWTGSAPCQPFSSAGAGEGFADERHLWPALHHLVRVRRPPVVLGEQVASKPVDDWIDLVQADLEGLGYAVGAVAFPAASVGAPHIRDRCYWGGRLGDADLARLEGLWRRHQATLGHWQGAARPAAASGQSLRLADADREGGEGRAALLESGDDWHGGAAGELADAAGGGRPQGRGLLSGYAARGGLADNSIHGRLADAVLQQRPGRQSGVSDEHEAGGRIEGAAAAAGLRSDRGPGPTNGFWADADWLYCRDDKWRPVEPGTQPLAHGLPRSLGSGLPGIRELARVAGLDGASLAAAKGYRVKALHGYGNAVNVYAAAAFIKAFYGA